MSSCGELAHGSFGAFGGRADVLGAQGKKFLEGGDWGFGCELLCRGLAVGVGGGGVGAGEKKHFDDLGGLLVRFGSEFASGVVQCGVLGFVAQVGVGSGLQKKFGERGVEVSCRLHKRGHAGSGFASEVCGRVKPRDAIFVGEKDGHGGLGVFAGSEIGG